ncbi:uncharacterized protein LOC123642152 [Lemur catta]|uniref:uncharacterized protein LOC123642152 n=1 Tax=Lemur catta TaxID=9447 RepID=UPI001E26916E|nr:uncharacterized protein LOC123642152 [Lemur catta]
MDLREKEWALGKKAVAGQVMLDSNLQSSSFHGCRHPCHWCVRVAVLQLRNKAQLQAQPLRTTSLCANNDRPDSRCTGESLVAFFINSGSCSVIQKPHTTCKIIAAIVMNSISVGVTVVGIVLICQQISVFESEATTYTWQNMVGMMLLQYLLFSTVSELIIAIIIVHWFKVALRQEEPTEESSLESSFPETSAPLPLEVPPSESNPP